MEIRKLTPLLPIARSVSLKTFNLRTCFISTCAYVLSMLLLKRYFLTRGAQSTRVCKNDGYERLCTCALCKNGVKTVILLHETIVETKRNVNFLLAATVQVTVRSII